MPNHKTLGVDLSFFLLHNLARKYCTAALLPKTLKKTALIDIELNAIDMALDTMLRFQRADLPEQFYRDFVSKCYSSELLLI